MLPILPNSLVHSSFKGWENSSSSRRSVELESSSRVLGAELWAAAAGQEGLELVSELLLEETINDAVDGGV